MTSTTILLAIVCLCAAVAVGGFYLLVRNEWVYNQRIRINNLDISVYRALPSYEYMLFRKFWVWDVHKFLPRMER